MRVIWCSFQVSLFVFCCLFAGDSLASDKVIRVQGQASVDAVPDKLSFSVYIRQRGESVSKLYSAVNQKTELLLSALRNEKVEDIQSMSIQVSPWIEYINNQRVQKGFELFRTIEVSLSDAQRLGLLLDKVFRVGNVEISNVNLMVSDQNQHYLKALQLAIKQAKQKAQLMAETLSRKVGQAQSVTELNNSVYPVQEMQLRAASTDSLFLPGQVQINAAVEVIFDLE